MDLKKIPLHDLHLKLGAKMVPFAGYEMPVRYSSDKEEHLAVRQSVGVFDVSHMGEFMVTGPEAVQLLQKISSNDLTLVKDGQAQYAYLPNDKGGIVDDFITYRLSPEKFMLVVNAANVEKDWNWISAQNSFDATVENITEDLVLLAVQGPKATVTLQKLTDADLSAIRYYHFVTADLAGKEMLISATGYTGAGGFELYIQKADALHVWDEIFKAGAEFNIQPIGLGARDTLRLEMGYCLYGMDIDDETSPLEAGLGWVTKFTKEFIHSDELKRSKEQGLDKKLIGFEMVEKGIPRSGYPLADKDQQIIGKVTSGTISPLLNKGIGMGYVTLGNHLPGTTLFVEIRNKFIQAKVVKPPFIT